MKSENFDLNFLLHGLIPRTPPGNPGGMVQFSYFFFPRREGGGGWWLFLETTLVDHGDIHTGLVHVLVSGIQL